MALSPSEAGKVALLKRYLAHDDEEIARRIKQDRNWDRRLASSLDAVDALLSETAENSSDHQAIVDDLKAQVAVANEALAQAHAKLASLEARLEEEHLEGKSLTSYQRALLGVAIDKFRYGQSASAVTSMNDSMQRAGLGTDPKTLRKMLTSSQHRLRGRTHREDNEIPE
jgi:hypothetical protein